MTEFYQRIPMSLNDGKPSSKHCMFAGLSACTDHVSSFICNAHASTIFGLVYKYVHTTDGNNEVNYSIVTYTTTSAWNWYLPLFKDYNTNIVSCDELMAFACNVTSLTNGKYDTGKLFELLSHYMSLTPYSEKCSPKTWFDENEQNAILLYEEIRNVVVNITKLPPLHRYLFAYMGSSLVKQGDESYKIQLDTVALKYKDASKSPTFALINKQRILKYTTHKDCIATPLVLASIRFTDRKVNMISFNQNTHTNVNQVC